ncbi:MAG: T9SS type A sorting domain-containing protein [Bacteroidota bacterium]
MKIRILFLAIIMTTGCCLLQAQNYRVFVRSGLSLFGDKSKNILTFNVESAVKVDADSVYFGIKTVRDTSYSSTNSCIDTAGGSVYGKQICFSTNGVYTFLNKDSDTIRVLSKAALNDSWTFLNISPELRLEATVIGKQKMNFLGQTDSVKIIRLLAKDNNNINVSHPLNNTSLQLSKNFGLIKTFDFYTFPYDTTALNLIGCSSPQIGKQDIKYQDVYNYNIGDEFHFKRYNLSWQQNGSNFYVYSGYNSIVIRTVSKKTVSANADTLTYEFIDCSKTLNYSNFLCDTSYRTDTLIENIIFSELDSVKFAFQPYELAHTSSGSNLTAVRMIYHSWHARVARNIKENAYYRDTCYYENTVFPSITYYTYIRECGGPYYSYGMNGQEVANTLEYFRKGSEVWGTPLGQDCPDLFSAIPPELVTAKISVFPNPASGIINVVVPGNHVSCNLSVFDMQGRTVINNPVNAGVNVIDVSSLTKGIYFVRLVDSSSSEVLKIIIQ